MYLLYVTSNMSFKNYVHFFKNHVQAIFMPTWHKLDTSERWNLNWESASIRSGCRQAYREFYKLTIDWVDPGYCGWSNPWAGVLGFHKKWAWANHGNLPVTSTPTWSLNQLLPPGSSQILVPALTSFSDGLLFGILANQSLFSPSCFVLVFHHSNRHTKRTIKPWGTLFFNYPKFFSAPLPPHLSPGKPACSSTIN